MRLLLLNKRKYNLILILLASFLWAAVWLSAGNFPTWAASGDLLSNSKAAVDISHTKDGILKVCYADGTYEPFPLTEGDGSCSGRVLENISGTRYGIICRAASMSTIHRSMPINDEEYALWILKHQSKTVKC